MQGRRGMSVRARRPLRIVVVHLVLRMVVHIVGELFEAVKNASGGRETVQRKRRDVSRVKPARPGAAFDLPCCSGARDDRGTKDVRGREMIRRQKLSSTAPQAHSYKKYGQTAHSSRCDATSDGASKVGWILGPVK
jgi:hypothetical protein